MVIASLARPNQQAAPTMLPPLQRTPTFLQLIIICVLGYAEDFIVVLAHPSSSGHGNLSALR
jgi:hypothetical protein